MTAKGSIEKTCSVQLLSILNKNSIKAHFEDKTMIIDNGEKWNVLTFITTASLIFHDYNNYENHDIKIQCRAIKLNINDIKAIGAVTKTIRTKAGLQIKQCASNHPER